MLGKNRKWFLAAIVVIAATLLILFWQGKSNPRTATADTDGRRTVKVPSGADAVAADESKSPVGKRGDRKETVRAPGRSKGVLLQEAQRVFGRAEAARARKVAEHFNETEATYIYDVEPPAKEEVAAVQAEITDLLKEVGPGDLEEFETMLKDEIDSYDSYGEAGRKVLMIMVPIEGPMRMRGMEIDPPDDPKAFEESFSNGKPYEIRVRRGWFASEDRKTLERFDQLMVWDPEKTE